MATAKAVELSVGSLRFSVAGLLARFLSLDGQKSSIGFQPMSPIERT
jgi:hypothetical protein